MVEAEVQRKLRRVLTLLYYSRLFDVAFASNSTTAFMERNACISWDAASTTNGSGNPLQARMCACRRR